MKSFVIILFVFTTFCGHSQVLKGEWEGSFTENKKEYPIFLEFVLNTDSSYSVFTYSKGGLRLEKDRDQLYFREDSVIVCAAYFKLLAPDSIYIEEIKVIQPQDPSQSCFQKMYLKLKKENNKIWLMGNWEGISCSPGSSGKIKFWKMNSEPD